MGDISNFIGSLAFLDVVKLRTVIIGQTWDQQQELTEAIWDWKKLPHICSLNIFIEAEAVYRRVINNNNNNVRVTVFYAKLG